MNKQVRKIYAFEFRQIKNDEETILSQTLFDNASDVKKWVKDNIDDLYVEDLYFAKGLNSEPLFTTDELKSLDPDFDPADYTDFDRSEMREVDTDEGLMLCQWELNEKEVIMAL